MYDMFLVADCRLSCACVCFFFLFLYFFFSAGAQEIEEKEKGGDVVKLGFTAYEHLMTAFISHVRDLWGRRREWNAASGGREGVTKPCWSLAVVFRRSIHRRVSVETRGCFCCIHARDNRLVDV